MPYDVEQLYGPAPKPPSLLKKAGRGAASVLAGTANLLDLPGSMVRDALGFENPLDQLLSPLSGQNRLQGRDLLRKYGLAGQKDTWGNWGAGLAVDVATDPLTYLTFGGSAVGKAGKVLKNAGLADEVMGVAAKAAGKPAGAIGPRVAKMTTTPRQAAAHGPADALARMQTAATGAGIDLTSIMDEPMNPGLAKFWPTGSHIGTGPTAQRFAGGMDWLGDKLRHATIPGTNVRPIGDVANLFNVKAGNATSRDQLMTAGKLFKGQEAGRAQVGNLMAKSAVGIEKAGFGGDEHGELVRRWLEYPDQAPAEVRPMIDELRAYDDDMLKRSKEWGHNIGDANERLKAANWKHPIPWKTAMRGLDDEKLAKHIEDLENQIREADPAAMGEEFNSLTAQEQFAKSELSSRWLEVPIEQGPSGPDAKRNWFLRDTQTNLGQTDHNEFGGVFGFDPGRQASPYVHNATIDEIEKIARDIEKASGRPGGSLEILEAFGKRKVPNPNYKKLTAEEQKLLNQPDVVPPRHWPRSLTEGIRHTAGGGPQPYSMFTTGDLQRFEWSYYSKTGTEGLHDMASDKYLAQIIDMGGTEEMVKKSAKEYLKKRYKDLLPQQYQRADGSVHDTFDDVVDDLVGLSAKTRASGIWGNHPLADATHRFISQENALSAGQASLEHLATKGRLLDQFNTGKSMKLSGLLKGLKMTIGDSSGGAGMKMLELMEDKQLVSSILKAPMVAVISKHLKNVDAAKKFHKKLSKIADLSPQDLLKTAKSGADDDYTKIVSGIVDEAVKIVGDLRVDNETAGWLTQMRQGFEAPDSVEGFVGIYDSWSNMVKSLLTNPRLAFHGRNAPAGQFNNALADQWTSQSIQDGHALATGQVIKNASKNPMIMKEAAKRGIQNLDDKAATEIARELAYAHEISSLYATQATHVTGAANDVRGGSIQDILGDIPGHKPVNFGEIGSQLMGKGTSWQLPVRGMLEPMGVNYGSHLRGVGGAAHSTFAPVVAGEHLGSYIEHMNRFPAWWALTSQGVDPLEAARRVGEAQAKYQNRFYTKFEQQWMSRVFPFYKFTKSQVPFTLRILTEKPGGPLAQMLRGLSRMRSEDEPVPSHIEETASIPMGELPDGSRRYFTGLGLPFEDPLSFVHSSPKALGLEVLSRTNPLIKGPLEWITGQSFFQRGPGGGRELEDLDPVIGRTMANIGQLTGLRESNAPVKYPGSGVLEHMASNSPISALLTTARTATDPRKGLLTKAMNLSTGLRVSDVSPASQDRVLRDRASIIEKELGARRYSDTYIPKDVQAKFTPKQRELADQLSELRRLLEARSKQRTKDRMAKN